MNWQNFFQKTATLKTSVGEATILKVLLKTKRHIACDVKINGERHVIKFMENKKAIVIG